MSNPQFGAPQYGPNPGPMPPANHGPAKRKRPVLTVLAFAGTFVFGLVVGVAAGGTDTTTPTAAADPAPTKTVEVKVPGPTKTVEVEVPGPETTVTAQPPKPKGPASTVPGDGVYQVGKDIKPGRYKSRPAAGGIGMCYISRLDGNGEIIDNQLSEGQVLITIKASDDTVEAQGCEDLVRQ